MESGLQDGYILNSDLCNSTALAWRDHDTGVLFHQKHEELCLAAASVEADDPRYKAMGDGAMVEFSSAVAACKAAMSLLSKAAALRATTGFESFNVKITVSHGSFLRSPSTQRWIGVLPTKSARFALLARKDEVWIDDVTRCALPPHLPALQATVDDNCMDGAAYRVLLKGFDGTSFSIHQLRPTNTLASLSADEKRKEWRLLWTDVEVWIERVAKKLDNEGIKPRWILGIGRSGAVLGGIMAGNLKVKWNHDFVPVSVVERTHAGEHYVLSTITDPPTTYDKTGTALAAAVNAPTAHSPGDVLVVLGEAKSRGSLNAARSWLCSRGIQQQNIREVALVMDTTLKATEPRLYDWFVEGRSALLPWQLVPGYDREWSTYRAS